MVEDHFKESNVHDILNMVLLPTLSDFKHKSKRDDWRRLADDGKFQLMDKFTVMFPSMGEGEKWMKILSYCGNVAGN